MKQKSQLTLPRLSVTSLSQYVRLENCERFLRFRLCRDEERALLKKWNLTIQPLTPLLKDSGAEFEQNVAGQVAREGEPVVDLAGEDLQATFDWLHKSRKPVILLQPILEGQLGNYYCNGRADLIRLRHDRQGRLHILIVDIKASRQERMEHRLQVAIYARLLQGLAQAEGLTIASLGGAVLHLQEDGRIPSLTSETPTFDLNTYLTIVDHLVEAPDSVVNRVATLPFEEVSYHMSYKCDGCLYNAICMYDSAERLDLSLVPYITPVEKRVLKNVGIKTVAQLATLMELPQPGTNHSKLVTAQGQEELVSLLANQWPVGQNLPLLVQRARRALRRFDPAIASRTFLYGATFGTLPHEEDHPNLIKIFFDAQRDYLQDRVYLMSALVTGPAGETVVVHSTDEPPTDNSERDLLITWVSDVIAAMRQVADGAQAPIHLYCYNRYDQRVLLEALKRHLDDVAAMPAFFDLMTQSPALSQSIISFLSSELEERYNLGSVCTPLHDAARMLGFNWADDQYEYYRLFRARLFDNRRDVIRQPDGQLIPAGKDTPKDLPNRLTIEAASRFNSQIPLEYAYAAWGCLPKDLEDDRTLIPFRQITLAHLQAFAGHRVRALAHVEASFKYKARWLDKPPFDLPDLAQAAPGETSLAQSLQEFLFMEHHAAVQTKLLTYSLPIERRVQTGLALLLRYEGQQVAGDTYRFVIDCETIGLDLVLTLNALRLKEGDWVVINPAEESRRASKIKNGRLATIKAIGPDWIELNLMGMTFWRSTFRYPHDNQLTPTSGQFYTLDEMADDMNADKTLEALGHTAENILYQWLLQQPEQRQIAVQMDAFVRQFANLIDAIERPRQLTRRQQEVIIDRLAEPLFLVQGPPGTGKSHTLAWAVLTRLAAHAAQGQPYRVAVSCKTHKAVNIVLEAIAAKWQRLMNAAIASVKPLQNLDIYKLVNDETDNVPEGVQALQAFGNSPQALDRLMTQGLIVIGGTPGGLYNLAKYRGIGGKYIDWSLKSFDLVVVDEASQMSLPEGILACAFLKPTGNAIVVGDHRQMPPIIAHNWESEEKRSITATLPYLSLFDALRERDFPWVALDESFRLHQTVAEFLQDNIYVHDGIHFFSRRKESLPAVPKTDPFIDLALDPRYPMVVIEHGEQQSQQYNELEIALVKPLIDACTTHLWLDGYHGVGVVVPHRAQKARLREHFPHLAAAEAIDTVERFQGGERDVIIVSATVSDPDYVLAEADFLLNLNRLNVALSRPRKKLIVVASRSVIELLTSDLEVFENAMIWKRLYYHYASDLLWQGERYGVPTLIRGRQ